jgi:hypothetical protein
MNICVHFLPFLAHFLSELGLFQAKVVEKIKTLTLLPVTIFPRETSAVLEVMCNEAGQR